MKKISLILVMLITVSGVVCASDIDNPKATMGMAVMKTGSTFKVFYKGEKSGTAKITIYDSKHKVVFTETIKNIESFVRPYNLSSMPEGEYTIELLTNDSKQVERVSNYKNKQKIENFINVVHVANAENKFMLSVPNKGTGEIKVDIYNGANLIYSQKESLSGDFAKIYNLNKVSGSIIFKITDKNGIVKSIEY